MQDRKAHKVCEVSGYVFYTNSLAAVLRMVHQVLFTIFCSEAYLIIVLVYHGLENLSDDGREIYPVAVAHAFSFPFGLD